MTAPEILDHHNQYLRHYEDQDEILTRRLDYDVLKEVTAKLPNLKDIVVSDANELRVIKKSPLSDFVEFHLGWFNNEKVSARHVRAILKGAEEAGTRLQSIRAAMLCSDVLDETQFGLHSMAPDLLSNLTTFHMGIKAVKEGKGGLRDEDPMDIASQLSQCRALVKAGTLRSAIDKMPNLVELDIQFHETHTITKGIFPSPALLRDVIPLDRVWPKLKKFTITAVETERQELGSFLVRHKQTLESLDLGYIRLTSRSWLKLLPYLKAQFNGTGLKHLRLLDSIIGRSEDEFEMTEAWALGYPDYDERRNRLGSAVRKYLRSRRQRRCPLRASNMREELVSGQMPGSDEEWEDSDDMHAEFLLQSEMWGEGIGEIGGYVDDDDEDGEDDNNEFGSDDDSEDDGGDISVD